MEDFDYEVLLDTLKDSVILSDFSYNLYEDLVKEYPEILERTTVRCEKPNYIAFPSKNGNYIVRIFRRHFNMSKKDTPSKVFDFMSFREYKKDVLESDYNFLLNSLKSYYNFNKIY